jgi:uncharacterized protein (TIGR02594 family)
MSGNTYLVRRGDTEEGLRSYFGDVLGDLVAANPQLKNGAKLLTPGTFISLPPAPPNQAESLHLHMAKLMYPSGLPWIRLARRELGTAEGRKASNPCIIEYLHSLTTKHGANPDSDQTAWCAGFMNWVLTQAGIVGTGDIRASSYLEWGVEESQRPPRVGSLAVFKRTGGGHVGFYTGESTRGRIMVLGGNEGNAVSEKPYPVRSGGYELLGYRWPTGNWD